VRFFILGRREAEAFLSSDPYAILGTTDPDQPDVTYVSSPHCRRILNLKFNDLRHPCCSEHRMFDDELAKEIAAFAHWLRESDVSQLVVHCEAGVSRSSATALALARFLGYGIEDVLDPFARFRPNTFIYWRLARELMPGRELELIDELFRWIEGSTATVLAANGVPCSEALVITMKGTG
jgi:hypothetical protein